MKGLRLITPDRLAKLIAVAVLATLATRYHVFLFLIDYIQTPVHSWMLVFASLMYTGFGLIAAVGLWCGRGWGNWTFYIHVLTGTIHFSYSVLPFTPNFANDYVYFGWFLGGNVAACLAVMAVGQARTRPVALAD